jgi:biotin carboxylase
MRPQLLLISTGARAFRDYLLQSIAPEYRVHLFTTTEPSWELPYLSSWTVVASTLDAEEMINAARAHGEAFDGVLCWDEARIQAAAEIAAALHLPGPTPTAIRNCRDKHLTRVALSAAAVAQPASVLVADLSEALTAAERIGYPVVLKPRALAASLGVVLVHDAAELTRQFGFARDTTVPGAPHYDVSVLVEEFADGPEISVDAAVIGGAVHLICVAHKELGYPPYFEETGHTVDGADPLMDDAGLMDILQEAHAAVGFSDGMTHTELRLTNCGPKIVEINARIGGDLIPYLGLRTTGIDPGCTAAAIACGRAAKVVRQRKLFGAVRFAYVDEQTTVGAIRFADGLPPAVDRTVVLAEPGNTYAPPPEGTVWGRVAYVTAIGDSAQECARAIDAASAAMRIDVAS